MGGPGWQLCCVKMVLVREDFETRFYSHSPAFAFTPGTCINCSQTLVPLLLPRLTHGSMYVHCLSSSSLITRPMHGSMYVHRFSSLSLTTRPMHGSMQVHCLSSPPLVPRLAAGREAEQGGDELVPAVAHEAVRRRAVDDRPDLGSGRIVSDVNEQAVNHQ